MKLAVSNSVEQLKCLPQTRTRLQTVATNNATRESHRACYDSIHQTCYDSIHQTCRLQKRCGSKPVSLSDSFKHHINLIYTRNVTEILFTR